MRGFNGTIFAYGQSGSGKTFSMLGPDDVVDVIKAGIDNVPPEIQKLYGIIPRGTFEVFDMINAQLAKDPTAKFEVKASYLEIYNECINNLLTIPVVTLQRPHYNRAKT